MKQFYIFVIFYLLCITNLVAQTTFDWENATDNGTTIEQTVNTITATFTVSSANPSLINVGGFGGSSGFIIGSSNNGVDTNATITFSSPVNITSLFALNKVAANPDADWTFIPTGGTNSNVVANVPAAAGVTVTLNWTNVTQIEITSSSGTEAFAFDSIISDFTLSTQEFENLNTQIKLFPNPTTDFIQISGLLKTEKYSISNILGSEIKKGTISNNEKLDTQKLNDGLYFLRFENGNTIKFIKK